MSHAKKRALLRLSFVAFLALIGCSGSDGGGSSSPSTPSLQANLSGAIGLGVSTPSPTSTTTRRSDLLKINPDGTFTTALTGASIDVIDFRYGREYVIVHGVFNNVLLSSGSTAPINCRLLAIRISNYALSCIQEGLGQIGGRASSYINQSWGNGFELVADPNGNNSGNDLVYYIYSDPDLRLNRSYLRSWSASNGLSTILTLGDHECPQRCQFRNLFADGRNIYMERYMPGLIPDGTIWHGPASASGPYTVRQSYGRYTAVRDRFRTFFNTLYDGSGNPCVGCIAGTAIKGIYNLHTEARTNLTGTDMAYCAFIDYGSYYQPLQRRWEAGSSAFLLSGFTADGDPNGYYSVTTDPSRKIHAMNLYQINYDGTCIQLTSSHILFAGVQYKDKVFIAGVDFSGNRVLYAIDLQSESFSTTNLVETSVFPAINVDNLWNMDLQNTPLMPDIQAFGAGIQFTASGADGNLKFGILDAQSGGAWTYGSAQVQTAAKLYFTNQTSRSTGF